MRGLHAAGYRVLLHYHRSEEAARQLAGELNAERPGSILTQQADLDDTAALNGLVNQAIDARGRLDALVNNASTFYPTPLGTVTESQLDAPAGQQPQGAVLPFLGSGHRSWPDNRAPSSTWSMSMPNGR